MQKKLDDLVSIGLPVFNGENYLAEAIESLLNQSHSNFELIISDNASTDRTARIIEQYMRSDTRIRAFRQDSNIGAAANYLFTLEKAQGNYFMWASHDDIWPENWIGVLLPELRATDIGIRGTLELFDNTGLLRKKVLPDFLRDRCVHYFLSDESEYKVHYIYSLFYTEKLRQAEMVAITDNYCPDCFFVYSLLQLGALRSTAATHLMYRVHPANLGKTYSAKWKGWRKIVYRIHPLSYYLTYLEYTKKPSDRVLIALAIPIKHIYAQMFFWFRGARELLFRRKFY